MASTKKVAVKTPASKTTASKKTAASKKVAAKAPAAKKTAANFGSSYEFGDIVVLVTSGGKTSEPGRVCRVLNFDRYCVNFADIGCKRVDGVDLRKAPSGSEAPDCAHCTTC